MKISQMLKREDFYKINEETLKNYFSDSKEGKTLFVYPDLNAIITSSPSNKVKKYLFSEYAIRGNKIKALLVKCYVALCLLTYGVFSSKKLAIKNSMTSNMLIYPCNKKYRIFDFSVNQVDVIGKSGFPKNDLMNEIAFRRDFHSDFIPEMISYNENGYRESIIEGVPLARVSENYDELCVKAVELLESYALSINKRHTENAKEYADRLFDNIVNFAERQEKNIDSPLLLKVAEAYRSLLNPEAEVELTLSHGDLQSGNVWIQNDGKIIIIDWESWGERSLWYDRAVMFKALRSGGIESYILNCDNKTEQGIVILEDIIFHLNELFNLPENYGEKEFLDYIKSLL